MRFHYSLLLTVFFVSVGFSNCDVVRSPRDCEADVSSMMDKVSELVEDAAACTTDAQCFAFDPSNECFGSCKVGINVDQLEHVAASIQDAEALYCSGYREDCGYMTPLCRSGVPECQDGLCVLTASTQ